MATLRKWAFTLELQKIEQRPQIAMAKGSSQFILKVHATQVKIIFGDLSNRKKQHRSALVKHNYYYYYYYIEWHLVLLFSIMYIENNVCWPVISRFLSFL